MSVRGSDESEVHGNSFPRDPGSESGHKNV